MVFSNPHPLEGTWLPFKAELAGESAPELALSQMSLVIEMGAYAVRFGHEVTDAGSYALSDASPPHTLTLVSLEGVNRGRTIPSIYQLVGDRLRICYGLDGTLPEGFAAPAGAARYLVTYRRQP